MTAPGWFGNERADLTGSVAGDLHEHVRVAVTAETRRPAAAMWRSGSADHETR
ncbi:MAG: hypothetical protein MUE84_02835 [Hyphomonas sp.]|nr:hypothetical protein [Hyphomonas sp.]